MLHKFVGEKETDGHIWLPFLPFVIKAVPQVSTRFSPFELLYGCHFWGVLDVMREEWEESPSGSVSPLAYVMTLQEKLKKLLPWPDLNCPSTSPGKSNGMIRR